MLNHTQIARFYMANMASIWVLSATGGPPVGPMDLAIRVPFLCTSLELVQYDYPSKSEADYKVWVYDPR